MQALTARGEEGERNVPVREAFFPVLHWSVPTGTKQ